MRRHLILLAAAFYTAGVGASEAVNDFPTQARVEFVLACMEARGGQSYDTLYPCICTIDKIASKLSYDAYTQSQTLSFLYGTPGERGGVFRDAAPQSRKRVEGFAEVRREAEAACFVGRSANAKG